MSDTLYVTPAQVLAAKLAIELSEEDGEEPDVALKAIANAQPVTDQTRSLPVRTNRGLPPGVALVLPQTAEEIVATADPSKSGTMSRDRIIEANIAAVMMKLSPDEISELDFDDLRELLRAKLDRILPPTPEPNEPSSEEAMSKGHVD